MAGSSSRICNLAKYITLTSLGITHKGSQKPYLLLPPYWTRLCIHDTLSTSSVLHLECLVDLVNPKLGGRAASKNFTRPLSSLPPRGLWSWTSLV